MPDAGIKAELEAVLQYGHAAKDGALSVQAVFTLIDVLKQWIKMCMADAGELLQQSDLMAARHVLSGLCTCPAAELASSAVASTRSRSTSSRSQTPSPKLDATTKRLEELLGSIPLDLLAQAAAHCGAHARALQYYEGFARAAYKGGLNPSAASAVTYDSEAVTFLQASLPTRHEVICVHRAHRLGSACWHQ